MPEEIVEEREEQPSWVVARDNPYVGPRAFTAREALYGRDKEALQLLDLVVAQRLALLYAPSGAGKTSLIQARLVGDLTEEGFHVLPLVSLRAGWELRASALPGVAVANHYRFATLLSLEAGYGPQERLPLTQLGGMPLKDYLDRRHESPPGEQRAVYPRVLIFDQFEEVIALDPIDLDAKEQFFRELGGLLGENRHLWALFSLREDYLAALEGYFSLFPAYPRGRLRLDLLRPEAALEAIQKPALAREVDFTTDAAKKLVDNLRAVKVRRPDGQVGSAAGPYVEPVQLQVVCRYLWQRLSPRWSNASTDAARVIAAADIETADDQDMQRQALDDVDRALVGYYNECVREAVRGDDMRERAVRDWVEQLITPQGVRGLVMLDPAHDRRPDDEALQSLQASHLVRKDQRGAAEFYELTHDRLIRPVRASNARWREQNLSDLQKQAAFWAAESRPKRLLFSGNTLAAAEKWAKEYPAPLSPDERDFLELSRAAQERDDARKTARLWLYSSAVAIASLVALAIVLGLWLRNETLNTQLEEKNTDLVQTNEKLADAVTKKDQALAEVKVVNGNLQSALDHADAATKHAANELKKFKAATLVQKALELKNSQLDLAFLLVSKLNEEGTTEVGTRGLRAFLLGHSFVKLFLHPCRACTGDNQMIQKVAAAPNRSAIACLVGSENIALLEKESRGVPKALSLGRDVTQVRDVAYIEGGPELAWVGTSEFDGEKKLAYCTHDPAKEGEPVVVPLGPAKDSLFISLSPHGTRVAVAYPKRVEIWSYADRSAKHDATLQYSGKATVLQFSHTGKHLALGVEHLPAGNTQSAQREDLILLWREVDAAPGDPLQLTPYPKTDPTATRGRINCVAFTTDQKDFKLACGGEDMHVRIWEGLAGAKGKTIPPTVSFRSHTKPVRSLAFMSKVALASGSYDKTIVLFYHVKGAQPREWQLGPRLQGHGDTVSTLAFSAGGTRLFSGGFDGRIIMWDTDDRRPLRGDKFPEEHNAPVQGLAWSLDGTMVATGGYDGRIFLWDPVKRRAVRTIPDAHKGKVQCVAFSPDGKWLASGAWEDPRLLLWDLAAKGDLKAVEIKDTGLRDFQTLAFHPKRPTLLAVAGYSETDGDYRLQLWDIDKKVRQSNQQVPERIWKAAWSPDGKTLATAGWEGAVTLWTVAEDGKVEQQGQSLVGNKGRAWGVAFHPGGKWLASSHSENSILLWELQEQGAKLKFVLPGHTATVESVAFDPSGALLVSGSWDGLVVLWDTSGLTAPEPQEPIPYLPGLCGHRDEVWGVAFSPSPESKLLTSISKDCRVLVWDWDEIRNQPRPPSNRVGDWIALCRKIANRELVDSEEVLFRDLERLNPGAREK